jgi:hypothetical protein
MSYEIIGDESLVAVVNPTRMPVEANVDIRGVTFHYFSPGVVDGKDMCIKFCDPERAEALRLTQPHLLRRMSAAAGRALIDQTRKATANGGDFWGVWKKFFGPVPAETDFVKAQEAKERASLVAALREHGIHDATEMPLSELRHYVANPTAYWDDKVRSMGADLSADPIEILKAEAAAPAEGVDAEEPGTSADESDLEWSGLDKAGKRAVLRSMGQAVPPNCGLKWMDEKYEELSSSENERAPLAPMTEDESE